jgi:integrase
MMLEPDLRQWIADTRALLDRVERSLAPVDVSGETFDQWAKRWRADRKARGIGDDRGRYDQWISKTLGWHPVAQLTRQDVETWIEWMEHHEQMGRLRSTTLWRVWTTLSSMLRDTYRARTKELRVRSDNPIRDIRTPDRGKARVGTFLYPSEFLKLMNCSRLHLVTRRRYALAVYLYPRAGELATLRWSDIDLRTGRIHIHSSRGGGTKTGEHRQFVVEPEILRLLRAMRTESPRSKYVMPGETSAASLRQALRAAGCRRADLHARDTRRRPITFHDLRATGITWMAMRGDSPMAISERVGHLHLATTEQYMRRGRLMALARGEMVFPELPRCLFGEK